MDPQDINTDATFTLEEDTFIAHAGLFSESAVYRNGERVRELDTETTPAMPMIVFSDGEFSDDEAIVERMNEHIQKTADELAHAYEEAEDKEEFLRSETVPTLIEGP